MSHTATDDFTTRTAAPPQSAPPEVMTARELWSRAEAAARATLGGKNYKDVRMDCAADVVAHVLGRVTVYPAPRPVTRGAFPLTREDHIRRVEVERWMRYPAAHRAASVVEDVAYIPVTAATHRRLCNLAANWRRSLDRQRARDAAADADTATDDFTAPSAEDVALRRPAPITPEDAHTAAREMLTALGLPRLGRCYPLAYTAARTAAAIEAERTEDGRATGHAVEIRSLDMDSIARELGIGGKTPGKALGMRNTRTARQDIPSAAMLRAGKDGTPAPLYSAAAHGSALGLEVEASPARKASATRTAAADMGDRANGWRDRPEVVAPVTVRMDPAARREDIAPPAWTVGLPSGTAHRLDTAAAMKRERMSARTPEDRERIREAAGIRP